jgi:uncharacterized membrane protein
MPPTFYMDAVITPNRSLSKRGLYWLIGVLIAFNLAVASLMMALGAFPVPIFLGVDVLAVILAFRASNRSGAVAERVQVTAAEVRILHQAGSRSRTVWVSPTALTRVAVEAPGAHEVRVRLQLPDRAVTIASALSPGERAAFAEALRRAIVTARRGPAIFGGS